MNSLPATVKYARFQRVTIHRVGTLRNIVAGPRDECGVGARVLGHAAPDLEIVELPASSQTHTLSAPWGIRAAQIAKTLALSVGGRAVLAVVCGDSRLDNKKVKAVLGGKARMLAPEEFTRDKQCCGHY